LVGNPKKSATSSRVSDAVLPIDLKKSLVSAVTADGSLKIEPKSLTAELTEFPKSKFSPARVIYNKNYFSNKIIFIMKLFLI
jgi:hypothetical protein